MLPGRTLYFEKKYDLRHAPAGDQFTEVNLLSAIRIVARSQADFLELPEPLWIRYYPKAFLIGLAWRLAGLLRGRSRSVGAYAIENNDVDAILFSDKTIPKWAKSVARLLFGASIKLVYRRLAFGSDGAALAYAQLPFLSRIDSKTILELPAKSSNYVSRAAEAPAGVFLGRLERRKGIERLMTSWPLVEEELPGAEITIIGDGPLSESVSAWCAERPQSRHYVGSLGHAAALAELRDCSVLVAPSQRDGRWREQIGLPISEALSEGLTVVTTSETGLAQWLDSTGHWVVAADPSDSPALIEAIVDALRAPIDRELVVGSLPETLGRVEADRWLNS